MEERIHKAGTKLSFAILLLCLSAFVHFANSQTKSGSTAQSNVGSQKIS